MENEEVTQAEPQTAEAEKPVKAEKAPREKPVERPRQEKPIFTTELGDEVRKYWNAPENQAKISAFLAKINFDARFLTDEHRFNFARMIEEGK